MIHQILPSSGSDPLRLQVPREILASTGDFSAVMDSTDPNVPETVNDATEDPPAEASMPLLAYGQVLTVDLTGQNAASEQQTDAAEVELQSDPEITAALPLLLQDPAQVPDISSRPTAGETQVRESASIEALGRSDGPALPTESGLVQRSEIPVENIALFPTAESVAAIGQLPELTDPSADNHAGRELAKPGQIAPIAGITVAQTGLDAIVTPEVAVQGEAKRPANKGDSIWATRDKLELFSQNTADTAVEGPVTNHPLFNFPDPTSQSAAPEAAGLLSDLAVEGEVSQQVQNTALTQGLVEANRVNITQSPPAIPVPVMAAPPDLARQVAQVVTTSETGGVEVLLNPEELGKMRFEIVQTNDSVRVVLYAERSETLDMLRRHGEQLLQEFRQSGFSGTSLSFGQWGQQEKSGRQALIYSPTETALVDGLPSLPQTLVAAAYVAGQGLNLRL